MEDLSPVMWLVVALGLLQDRTAFHSSQAEGVADFGPHNVFDLLADYDL